MTARPLTQRPLSVARVRRRSRVSRVVGGGYDRFARETHETTKPPCVFLPFLADCYPDTMVVMPRV